MSPSDQALLALACLMNTAMGCQWIALTPVREPGAMGSRHIVDLSSAPPTVRTDTRAVPTTIDATRLFQLPEDRLVVPHNLAPPTCRTLLAQPLHSGGSLVGLLEIAWDEPRPDVDARDLAELLPLAALLADHRLLRERAAELEARLEREVPYLRGELRAGGDLRALTGEGPAMRAVRLAIQQVAPTDSTALILGETGTGKELVARAIHQLSPRRDRLLVAVNCAALAPSVIASELFGHEAGAFTGATRRRIGRFELAHGGTLFLDEIAELSPDVQVMLLRVLQERSIERVGGHQPIAIDVRLIAATHQDLSAAVRDGRFRADVFYRLNVFPISVPPLRERPEDIADLTRHFIHQFNRQLGKRVTTIDPESLLRLTAYSWPGNVRELENLIERAMIVNTGEVLRIDATWLPAASAEATLPPASLLEMERRSIVDALRRAHGRIYGPAGAAALLGIKPTTLYGKMRRHGIPRNA
jgi:formate hydrogenlyase transcriptional activator